MAEDRHHKQDKPLDQVKSAQPESVACPFCGSSETELFSRFGSMLMSAQHYCRDCRTVFDRVRWDLP